MSPQTLGALCASVYNPPQADKAWRADELFPDFECAYFSYARRALVEGLRAAGIDAGAKVLLPEFICREVLSSLAAVEAHPVFYPVGEGLTPAVPPARWPKAFAVLAVDYFGFPQDLTPFRAYCASADALLIEDNSHGLFSRDTNGCLLGTRADMGIFSLRKTIPLANGGLLALKKGGRKWRLLKQSSFQQSSTTRHRAKTVLRKLSSIFGTMPANRALKTFWTLRRLLRGGHPGDAPELETELPSPKLPCAELASPITAADPQFEAQRRRELYLHLAERLAPHVTPVFPSLEAGVVPYGFAYRCRTDGRAVDSILDRLNITAMPWPLLPETVAGSAPAHYWNVKLVPFLLP